MSIKLTPRKKLFVETAAEMFGNGSIISKSQLGIAAKKVQKKGLKFRNETLYNTQGNP